MISSDHGAAIQLVPSQEEEFQCHIVSDEIGQAVFAPRSARASAVEPDTNGLGDDFRIIAEDIALVRLNVRSIRVFETGSVITKEMIVHGTPYPNTMIVKGSNQRRCWGARAARADARRSFQLDLISAYLFSQEFREFVAAPELTNIVQNIVAKRNKGLYAGRYGYIQFRDDLATLVAKAKAYGTSAEFATSIYDFLENEKPWYERHWILSGLVVSAIVAILGLILKLIYRKFVPKRTRR